ncbi:hypothetical protein ACFLQW_02400 [Candidatus Zixiibacteriota bacterium]
MTTVNRGFALLLAGLAIALSGCGSDSTSAGPGNGETGRAVDYFNLEVGFEAYYRLYDHNMLPAGTSRFAIIDQFVTADLSGYVAVDSVPRYIEYPYWVDTFWIVSTADTVFSLVRGRDYQDCQPIVRNRTQTDYSRHLYSKGNFGSSSRYNIFFHQVPEADTVILSSIDIFTNCGRTDRLAVFELTGDTVSLGSEYFAPNIGKVLTSTRLDLDWPVYYKELIR